MNILRVAAVQMRGTRDIDRNIADATALIERAAFDGAVYVQTPEITNLVERNRKRVLSLLQPEASDPAVAAFGALAARLKIWLHIGSLALRDGDSHVNRGLLFAPDGRVAARYDKIHMFDVDLDNGESWRESAFYRPGDRAVVADAGPLRLGMGICYDLRFPPLFLMLANAGAELITAPACFTRQTGEAHWHVLTRARAIECGAFLVAAAQCGEHEDGRSSFGHAVIVDPWGRILADAGDDPGVVSADLDLAAPAAARRKIPNLANARSFRIDVAHTADALRTAS